MSKYIKKIATLGLSMVLFLMSVACVNASSTGSQVEANSNGYIQYSVRYLESGTSNQLQLEKIVVGNHIGEKITEMAPNIAGFKLVGDNSESIKLKGNDVITFYYEPTSMTTVEPTEPQGEEASTRASYIPTGKYWNIATKGTYYFNADVNISNMYTNYYFYGKTKYKVVTTNYGSANLLVQAKSAFKTYSEMKIYPPGTLTLYITTPSKDTKFYVKFSSDNTYVDVRGYVE